MLRTKLLVRVIDNCNRCDFNITRCCKDLKHSKCGFGKLRVIKTKVIPNWCPLEDVKKEGK